MKRISRAGLRPPCCSFSPPAPRPRRGLPSPPPEDACPCPCPARLTSTRRRSDANDKSFAVAEVGPSGTIPHENLEGGIWVLFNRPVVALTTLCETRHLLSACLQISPRDRRHLSLVRIASVLLRAQRAALRRRRSTLSASAPPCAPSRGSRSDGDTQFTFRTEPLQICRHPLRERRGARGQQGGRRHLQFPRGHEDDTPFIRLQADGDRVASPPRGPPSRTGAARPLRERRPARLADAGARSAPGCRREVRVLTGQAATGELRNPRRSSAGFHTLLPLAVEESTVAMGRNRRDRGAAFQSPAMREDTLPGTSPRHPGSAVAENLEVSGSSVLLHKVPRAFRSSFTLTVARGLTDTYGQTLGADRTVSFEVGAAAELRRVPRHRAEDPRGAISAARRDGDAERGFAGRYVIRKIASPFGNPPTGPAMDDRHGAIPRNVRHFEIFDLTPYLNDAGRGTAYLSWVFKGLFWGSDTTQDSKDELVVQVTDIGASINVGLQLAPRPGELARQGAPITDATVTLRKDGARSPSGRDRRAGSCGRFALATGSRCRRLQGARGEGGAGDPQGQGPARAPAFEMPGRTWNANEPYSAESPAHLHMVGPGHLQAGRDAFLCRYRPRPHPGEVHAR